MKRIPLVPIARLALVAAIAVAGWARWQAVGGEHVVLAAGSQPAPVPTLVGQPAPAFALENLATGKKVSLADFKGKAVLINFWATWCAPCKIETPWLIELRSRYAQQGFEVLGISADDLDADEPAMLVKEKKDIARFVEQQRIPYPVLIGGDALAAPYGGLDQLPISFFVDRQGIIVAEQMGLASKSDLEEKIRQSLGK